MSKVILVVLSLTVVVSVVALSLSGCGNGGGGTEENGNGPPPPTLTSCSSSQESVNEGDDDILACEVRVEPAWEDERDLLGAITSQNQDSTSFYLFWDRSSPMGGYIHGMEADSQSALQNINQSVLDARLRSDYLNSRLECTGIGNPQETIGCDSVDKRSRDFFGGGQSPIDEAIKSVVDSLRSGSVTGAVLISDMMATTENGEIGINVLRQSLRDIEPYFNEGGIHMAILGIRLHYWGVQKEKCQPTQDPWECWYDEVGKRWVPLGSVVKRPVYVFVLGRNTKEDHSSRDNPVRTMTTQLQSILVDSGFDVKSEIVTLGELALSEVDSVFWSPQHEAGKSQPIYMVDGGYGYYCKVADDKKTYALRAEFAERDPVSIDEISGVRRDSLGLFTDLPELDENGIRLDLDCGSVRKHFDQRSDDNCHDGRVKHNLGLFSEVTLKLRHTGESRMEDWSMWSSSYLTHGDTLTFGLDGFIKDLRPTHYQAVISPVPPLACH